MTISAARPGTRDMRPGPILSQTGLVGSVFFLADIALESIPVSNCPIVLRQRQAGSFDLILVADDRASFTAPIYIGPRIKRVVQNGANTHDTEWGPF